VTRLDALRVAFVAGTLDQGGAEKQLVCMVKALREAGAQVQVHALADQGHHARTLADLGCAPIFLGARSGRLSRLRRLAQAMREFQPHVVQSGHFYANPYAILAARTRGALAVGAIRSDGVKDLRDVGRWGRWLLRSAPVLIVNSRAARNNAVALGMDPDAVHILPNVLPADDPAWGPLPTETTTRVQVVAVAGLHPEKRLDRFLRAVAAARGRDQRLVGALAGQGVERERLEALATDLSLLPDGVRFLGHRSPIAPVLRESAMLVLTSQHEGFPNVVLEAMAAGLPVITTPAGDAGVVVQDGVTGFVVDFDDHDGLVDRIVRLAASPELRLRFGAAGQRRARDAYGPDGLAAALQAVYLAGAQRHQVGGLLQALRHASAVPSRAEKNECPA
jgi:glycosyltransferase involved in cell wall biosynthesis